MAELYKGIEGSPITYLAADISANQTTISIDDDSALPDAPNICTIGYGENLETIKYESKSNGVLQGVTRGIEGTPRAWPSGTEVARFFTAYDHLAIIDGIAENADSLTTHLAESAKKHIAESGSNENGRYIKFDDGTMLCFRTVAPDRSIQNTEQAFLLPATYISVPAASASHIFGVNAAYQQSCGTMMIGVTTTAWRTAFPNITSIASTNDMQLLAVGRWK